jgi:hypothetical protein
MKYLLWREIVLCDIENRWKLDRCNVQWAYNKFQELILFFTLRICYPASYQMGSGVFFPCRKIASPWGDHSPPPSAMVNNVWSYISTHLYVSMAWCVINHRDNFTPCALIPRILIDLLCMCTHYCPISHKNDDMLYTHLSITTSSCTRRNVHRSSWSWILLVSYQHILFINLSVHYFYQCGGGLEYPHRSPTNRRRRRKGNPVPGHITGPPCHWGT